MKDPTLNKESLHALREITASERYSAAENKLRHRLIVTDSLKSIILETEKLHSRIAEVADAEKPWAEDNRHRSGGLLVTGNAGCGKSFSVETAIRLLGPVAIPGGEIEPKVWSIRTPASGTAGSLAREIIVRSGLPITREPKDDDAARKVINAVVRKKPTMIFVDEVSRCTNPDRHAARALQKESGLVWTMAISLLDETAWSTPLIYTGLTSLIDSLYVTDKNDHTRRLRTEAKRRFVSIRIPDATIEKDGPMLEHIIAQYCEELGVGSVLSNVDEIGARLVHAANYAFGTALVMAQKAVALAATRDGAKGKLKRADFAAIYHFMSGGSMDANIFSSGRWSEIDPNVVLPESFKDAKFKETDHAA